MGRLSSQHETDEGFTLIELLVVVIIIGILAAVAIPVFLNQREKARNAAANSDARNLTTGMETYYTEEFEYTTDASALTDAGTGITVGVEHAVCTYDNLEKYVIGAWHPQGTNLYLFDSATGILNKLNVAEPMGDASVAGSWRSHLQPLVALDPALDDCDELTDATRF